MSTINLTRVFMAITLSVPVLAFAQPVPKMVPYSGSVSVSGEVFSGQGEFKFAVIDKECILQTTECQSVWSNDASSVKGSEPTDSVLLPVNQGRFSVNLGNTNLSNMIALPVDIFNNTPIYLRVWFNDGNNGFQELSADRQFVSVPYAYHADIATTVIDNAIGKEHVKPSEIQARISTCNVGSTIQEVKEDGQVVCETSKVYSAGAGLAVQNDEFSIDVVTMTKIDSAAAKAIVGGNGLKSSVNLGVQTLAIDTAKTQARITGNCNAGQSIRSISEAGTVTCETDNDSGGDITGVTTGTGLSGGGNSGSVTIQINSLTAAKIDAAATKAELLVVKNNSLQTSNQIDSSQIKNNSLTGTDIKDYSIGSIDLAKDSVGNSELSGNSVAGSNIINGTIRNVDISEYASISASKINRSGLDADKLDGKDSTAFSSASHNHNTLYLLKTIFSDSNIKPYELVRKNGGATKTPPSNYLFCSLSYVGFQGSTSSWRNCRINNLSGDGRWQLEILGNPSDYMTCKMRCFGEY